MERLFCPPGCGAATGLSSGFNLASGVRHLMVAVMTVLTRDDYEKARELLMALGCAIRQSIINSRLELDNSVLSEVAGVTEADTIYTIDKISEAQVLRWFEAQWPMNWPVCLVMEGLEGDKAVVYPLGTPEANCIWTCIIDPIDGTRPIMYDKRSAWSLCALAPWHARGNTLSDIAVACMTELPTSKAGFADQFSAVRGVGKSGVRALRYNLFSGVGEEFELRPSTAARIDHGFGQLAKFFPDGKAVMAEIEAVLCEELTGSRHHVSPLLFDDQYISTGGQFAEILLGHDRFCADVRPEIYAHIGCGTSLVCHPYDACCWIILDELGCPVTTPDGAILAAPLDTTSPVSWLACANQELYQQIQPILARQLSLLCSVQPLQ
ncbi:MAG: inositol monophosphatase [Verrucomicrobia bacterium]|nr:inositol monophosphatase [Verrucomicrobiota bacterium]